MWHKPHDEGRDVPDMKNVSDQDRKQRCTPSTIPWTSLRLVYVAHDYLATKKTVLP